MNEEFTNNNTLDNNTNDILSSIVEEQNPDKLKDLTHLFNLNMIKKNALRVSKLNEILDKISFNIVERFEKRSDEFSNKDLIDYMNAINSAVDRAQKEINLIDNLPAITYNQQNNQVNINIGNELPRESREKITQVIESIMKKLNKDQVEGENNEESK